MTMYRNMSAQTEQFAMVPKADVPRSVFAMQKTLKTTFDAGFLVPIFCEEVLPGDTFKVSGTLFGRLATPITPIMDNLHLETFFFFVPNRILWDNWVKFMGEQTNPADSISFTVPTITSPVGGYAALSIFDYFGLPTFGQLGGANTYTGMSLPLRAYNDIWNEWFRDENLQPSVTLRKTDGGDVPADYTLLRRGKRKDYFTGSLPFVQKGVAVTLPLGSTAPIRQSVATGDVSTLNAAGSGYVKLGAAGTWVSSTVDVGVQANLLYADLQAATSATVNQLRQSFQIQKLLERDARGGTRYTELVRAHFGVISPDARLQRPEYLGGGHTMINVNPVAQTSGTGASGQTTPLGNLSAFGTTLGQGHGFNQSFTEHGFIIGLASVRADLTYQQGVRKFWNRSTRYDFYFPVFQALGEQAVLNREIFCDGSANDLLVFGYQERWAEYRYNPNQITGLFKSTTAGTIDIWHLAQRFTALPTLNSTFVQDTPPLSRALAVGAAANGQQIILDSFWAITAIRPLPMYSVPGLIDHF
ncbi:MAG: major capsid protein [Microvirus sp.]|nr:MAG: major capsid protein [Microvirus sp.]